jgi:hypothetical protein
MLDGMAVCDSWRWGAFRGEESVSYFKPETYYNKGNNQSNDQI